MSLRRQVLAVIAQFHLLSLLARWQERPAWRGRFDSWMTFGQVPFTTSRTLGTDHLATARLPNQVLTCNQQVNEIWQAI